MGEEEPGPVAVGLILAAQGLADRGLLESELAARRATLADRKARLWKLKAQATKERLDVDGPAGHAVSKLLAKLTSAEGRLQQEELEAMRAEMAVVVASEDIQEESEQIRHLEARVAALAPLEAMRRDLLKRKAVLLHRAGDERIREVEAMAGQAALWSRGLREFDKALVLVAACRHGVRVLRQENPRGPIAGKLDISSDGLVGWLATRRKYANVDTYNGHGLALRALLRELDASPVVEAPELQEMVPVVDVSEALRLADTWTEFIGPAALVDLAVMAKTRRPMAALSMLDGKLVFLQDRLEQRRRAAHEGLVSWQEAQRRFVEGL